MEARAEIRRRTRLSPAARRKQLMECAIEVFSERGIGRAGHAEIAEKAKVSVATVFNYFNTREDLVDEVLNEVELFLTQLLDSSHQQEKAALDRIHDHMSQFVTAAQNQSDFINIWLEWSSSVREETWSRYAALLARMQNQISTTVQLGFDNNEFSSNMSAEDASRALTGIFYVVVQMLNQAKKPSEGQIIDFVNDYVTSILRPLQ